MIEVFSDVQAYVSSQADILHNKVWKLDHLVIPECV